MESQQPPSCGSCSETPRCRGRAHHLHTATQDAVDLPKMVQVVCRFQADELLDRLPSAYLVDPIALHPPCAWGRLQQSLIAPGSIRQRLHLSTKADITTSGLSPGNLKLFRIGCSS